MVGVLGACWVVAYMNIKDLVEHRRCRVIVPCHGTVDFVGSEVGVQK